MRLTLNNFGYQAEHFNSIASLDAALEQQIPDALIVDVNLANEDCSGLDYAASLQQRLEVPLPLLVLTNCEVVELRYGNHPPKRLTPDRVSFPHLPHPPVIFERRHFTDGELGLWGDAWVDGEIVGYVAGQQVAEVRLVCNPVASRLEMVPDSRVLGATDSVRVMVRALDQVGNRLPHFSEPVEIAVSGAGRRIGPRLVPLRAGSTGFWVQATGRGEIDVTVSSERLGTIELTLAAG